MSYKCGCSDDSRCGSKKSVKTAPVNYWSNLPKATKGDIVEHLNKQWKVVCRDYDHICEQSYYLLRNKTEADKWVRSDAFTVVC